MSIQGEVMMKTNWKRKKVTIIWGIDKDPANKQEYKFETEEQLQYFMLGVDESIGRLENRTICKNGKYYMKQIENMSFSEIIDTAEKMGWKDPNFLTDGEWTANDCDETEQSAIMYILRKLNEREKNDKTSITATN